MKTKLLLVAFVITVTFGITSCNIVFASGTTIQHDYNFQAYDSVVISSAFTANITQSDAPSLKVIIDEAGDGYLDVYQSGSTIYIGMKPNFFGGGNFEMNAEITLPALTSINVSGASSVNVYSINPQTILANVSGASSLVLYNSNINHGSLNISGASSVQSSNSLIQTASIDLSGASYLALPVNSSVSGSVSGASSLIYGTHGPNTSGLIVSGASSAGPY